MPIDVSTSQKGTSPLSSATSHLKIDVVKVLIKHGAQINLQDMVRSRVLLVYIGLKKSLKIGRYNSFTDCRFPRLI